MPNRLVEQLSSSTFTGANGANFALSRRANGLTEGAAWVVPGADHICIVGVSAIDTDQQIPQAVEEGAACDPDTMIASGSLMTYGGTAGEADGTFVVGLVPDGITKVTATSRSGGRIYIAVHENLYVATLEGGDKMSFEAGGGHIVNVGTVRSTAELDGVSSPARQSRSDVCRPGSHHCER